MPEYNSRFFCHPERSRGIPLNNKWVLLPAFVAINWVVAERLIVRWAGADL